MISLQKRGQYRLITTKNHTNMLILDDTTIFAWITAQNIGEVLVFSHSLPDLGSILIKGSYRLYSVKDEPKLTDLDHLELFVGEGTWQGYLLPTGLPTNEDKRNRIIPTNEIITKSTR